MPGAIVCDRWREMPAEKIEEGDTGRPHLRRQCRLEDQRRGGALLPREGQGWPVTARRRVEQHKKLRRQLIEPELRPVLARQDAS